MLLYYGHHMTHHHHDLHDGHPSPSAGVSLLRMSARERLVLALAVASAVWAAAWWAMS